MTERQAPRRCRGCGAHLARDNSGVHCGPCQRRRDEPSEQPPAVPPEFWADSALRQAFASRHIGRIVRAYRHHPWHGRPLPQERMAACLNLSQAQLSRIESGPAVQDLTRLIAWARLLGMPQERLWFKLPDKREASVPSPPPTAGLVASGGVASKWAAVSVEDLPPAAAFLSQARADGSIVEVLRGQLDESKGDDGRLGPAAALPKVLGVLGAVQNVIREVKPDVRRLLLTVGAEGAEFVGWLYRDLRDLRTATYWYDRAIEWAHEADDSVMQGYVLLRKSQLAYDRRDALRVLTLAEAAQRSSHLPPGVWAEATQQEALGLAMLGEPLSAVERKLDAAHQLLERPSNEDAGTLGGSFTGNTLLLRSTACYTEAGKPARAAEILGEVLTGDTLSSRDAGYFQARRAAALALIGEPDEAAILGLEAARVARTTRSRRTATVLTDMLLTLDRWNSRPHVRALRDFLAERHTG